MGSKEMLQIIGVALGLLYLWLEYRANIWLWLVGAIMPVVHGILYFKSGLYADCSMQAYYVLASIYGLAVWRRTPRKEQPHAGISHTPLKAVPLLAAVSVAAQAAIYLLLTTFTNSTVPFWDSLTTALSITAMWMLSRKYMEQWLVWIAVDAVTVGLYIYKDIPMTAGLYALYTVLAAAGYMKWRKEYRLSQRQP